MKRITFFINECIMKRIILNENETMITSQFIEILCTEDIAYINVFLLIDKIIDHLPSLPFIMSIKEMGYWGLFIGNLMCFINEQIKNYSTTIPDENESSEKESGNYSSNMSFKHGQNGQFGSNGNFGKFGEKVNFHYQIGKNIISKEQMEYMKHVWIEKINFFILGLIKQNNEKMVLIGLEFIQNCFENVELCWEIRSDLEKKIYHLSTKIRSKINELNDLFDFVHW